jgi:hypothetical protein
MVARRRARSSAIGDRRRRVSCPVMDPARQFDFWLGNWEVREPSGELAGTNLIELIMADHVLLEHWEGAGGVRGTSFSMYAAGRGAWHQTWVDTNGTLLLLDGGLHDGAMVLEGATPSRERPGAEVHHRISWSVIDGDRDRVRQHWESSKDGGATWDSVFDGRYTRV